MGENLELLGLAIIKLFVVMDPVAILPLLAPYLGDVDSRTRGRVIRVALLTASVIGLLFLGFGTLIFTALGISVSDFLVAGGLILLVLALKELSGSGSDEAPSKDELLAVVPIGTPLLVGPATISMLIVLTGQQAVWTVLVAFLVNIVIAFVIFRMGGRLLKLLGKGGLKAFTRIVYLLLAAIAVQLISQGLPDVLP